MESQEFAEKATIKAAESNIGTHRKFRLSYLLIPLFLLVTIPITIFVLRQNNDPRSRADSSAVAPPPVEVDPSNAVVILPVDNEIIASYSAQLRNYIKPTDIFMINVGPLDMNKVNEIADLVKQNFPDNQIFAQSGPNRTPELAESLNEKPEFIFVDHEISSVGDSVWDWNFQWTRDQVASYSATIRPSGKSVGLTPTGSALQQDKGWDYGVLGQSLDFQIVQTAGFCKRDIEGRLKPNLDKLASQYVAKGVSLNKVATTISIFSGNENEVDAPMAVACTKAAMEKGLNTVNLFGRNFPVIKEYFRLIRSDNIKPLISLSKPIPNATVSGFLALEANATDNIGVTKVEFYRDTTFVSAETSAPYQAILNTTSLPEGKLTLNAKAYDEIGNIGVSQPVSVTVKNDRTAPSLTVTRSGVTSRSITKSIVVIGVEASDERGMKEVQIYINDSLQTTMKPTTDPKKISGKFSWSTSGLAKGTYVQRTIAIDSSGNSTKREAVLAK